MKKNEKSKKKNSNVLRYVAFTIIIMLVFIGGTIGAIFLLNDKNDNTEETVNDVHTNIDSLEAYNINCDDNDTELYHTEYNKLKDNLNGTEIDYDDYAASIAKLFIIDLYTIKNKTNKYDVGGIEFVYPASLENYRLNVEDTIYKYVKDNTDGKRIQNLPVVSSITIVSTKKSTFEIKDDGKYDSYVFNMKWDYVNDYDYDKTGEVIVINKDNKMYVVEKN